MYDTVLFDLDGTLTDPYEGITKSVVYALKKFGITVENREELKSFIGPPLYKSFMIKYGFSQADALRAVEYYREYFGVTGLFENAVYDGVEEMLKKLSAAGKKLIVATSKPEVFSVRIAEHFCLSKYLYAVVGATLDSSRIEKADVIAHALKTCKVADISRAIMVGDRENDIFGAKANGIKSVGVLCGYGSREELNTAGADYIVDNTPEILNIVM